MMQISVVKDKKPDTLSRYSISCAGPSDIIRDADEEVSAFAFTTDHTLGTKLILSHGATSPCCTFSPLL